MEFTELVKKFSPYLKRLSSKVAISSRVIGQDDLYQEMLYHLWEGWKRGEFEGKNDAYIRGGCYFHLKNYLRKNTEQVNVLSLDEPLDEKGTTLENIIPDKTTSFDVRVDDALFIQQMKNKELTRREQEVTELLAQGYTVRDIGKRLNISHVRVLKIKENIGSKFTKRLT
ncbi:sigma-70 family RNA polymerase sigma factor [Candidatus Desantisbacteria bacterium]|nr:sigma-70 family RNA polymerase sigma factor [Candidatus Desantisbacteria bacterium]